MARSTNTQFAVAVHVLTYLAGVRRPVSSDELAGSTQVNPVHIRRVLGPLREAGLVRSRPGVGGGWELDRDADTIGLDQVWGLLQGDDPVLAVHGPNPRCPVGRAIQDELVELDRQVTAAVRRSLADRTVGDIVQHALPNAPTR